MELLSGTLKSCSPTVTKMGVLKLAAKRIGFCSLKVLVFIQGVPPFITSRS